MPIFRPLAPATRVTSAIIFFTAAFDGYTLLRSAQLAYPYRRLAFRNLAPLCSRRRSPDHKGANSSVSEVAPRPAQDRGRIDALHAIDGPHAMHPRQARARLLSLRRSKPLSDAAKGQQA